MKQSDLVIRSALASLLAIGLATGGQSVLAAKDKDMDKCAGIAKAGKNDCGTSKHACAGQGKVDADKEEWVYVAKGSCEKIVGGQLVMKK